MIVLIGNNTKVLYKFVRWEMDVALELGIPIVAVNLNGKKKRYDELCPAIIRDELVLHVPFKQEPIQWAIDNWCDHYTEYKSEGKSGAYTLNDDYYKKLGL